MTGIADDIIKRADALAADRSSFDRVWREVADVVAPNSLEIPVNGTAADLSHQIAQPRAADRATKIYDSTGVWASDRLASGLESLITPQSEKWHGMAVDDPLAEEPTDEEKEYLDKLRDYLFAVRYDARSGFVEANQNSYRSVINFGTGLMFTDEGFDKSPITYRPMSVSECYLAVDQFDQVDTCFRQFTLTARQAVQKFGERVSEDIKKDADNDSNKGKKHVFIHAVQPRQERGSRTNESRNSEYASYHIERDNRMIVGESGFFEFPYIVYRWSPQPGQAYGEGPVMLALSDVKTLNAMSKTALRAGQQAVDPPLAIADDGVTNRPNLNARAVNYGAIDANGRLKIQPIITAQRPDLAENLMAQRRESVRESMYINLFQILLQNPNMTATEALIRANEKGQLLGPAGARIQNGLSRLVDREIGILNRKGFFEGDSPMAPPDGLLGKDIGTKFTSPLDKLRRSNELIGVRETFAFAAEIAQFKPGVLDNLDEDEAIRLAADINGAPKNTLKRTEERDEGRAQRQQIEQAMQSAQMVKEGSEAAQAAGEAAPALQELANVAQPQ